MIRLYAVLAVAWIVIGIGRRGRLWRVADNEQT